jgi:hypothetical protein
VLRDVLKTRIRTSWLEGASDPRESRNPKDTPPIGVEEGRLRLFPALVRDRASLLERLRPRYALGGATRLLRPAGVNDQSALLEEGNRGGSCLLPVLRAPSVRRSLCIQRTVRKTQSSPSKAGCSVCRRRNQMCRLSASTASRPPGLDRATPRARAGRQCGESARA